MEPRATVVPLADAPPAPGQPTSGMDRRVVFADDAAWVGWVRTEPGIAGGWHHHGEHDSYIYVIRGSIIIEFGPGGRERVEAGEGDVIRNPARMIHREITPAGAPVEALVVRVGSGPLNVNVDGPDAAEVEAG